MILNVPDGISSDGKPHNSLTLILTPDMYEAMKRTGTLYQIEEQLLKKIRVRYVEVGKRDREAVFGEGGITFIPWID